MAAWDAENRLVAMQWKGTDFNAGGLTGSYCNNTTLTEPAVLNSEHQNGHQTS
jgi:hypothetical protein